MNQNPRENAKPSRAHYAALDGLRGIAILLVIGTHTLAIASFLHIHPSSTVGNALSWFLFGGWTGVDLFFVISGFLITGILIDSRLSLGYFRNFYIRRTLRIFPLYYAVLALTTAALPLIKQLHMQGEVNTTDLLSCWLYLSNWRAAFGHSVFFLSHFWSLAIEEQFYLLWPAIVYLSREKALLRICITCALSSLALRCAIAPFHPEAILVYMLTPFRVEPLMYGALVALAIRDRKLRGMTDQYYRFVTLAAAFGFIAMACLAGSPQQSGTAMYTAGYTFTALMFAGCVFWCATKASTANGAISNVLNAGLLKRIGKLSYCMYIVHLPIREVVVRVFAHVAPRFDPHPSFTVWAILTYIMVTACSLAVATLSWKYFEQPILRLKDRFAPYQFDVVREPPVQVAATKLAPYR